MSEVTPIRSVEQIEAEIAAARERLATTVDELHTRTAPKEIARRQAESLKAKFTEATQTESGDPRTERIAALAAAAVALIGLGAGVATVADESAPDRPHPDAARPRAGVHGGRRGERAPGGGIVIPAMASVGKRLAWATVVATSANVRQVKIGDRVLFDPEDRAEVELQSRVRPLRERDIHAVAAQRVQDGQTGPTFDHGGVRRPAGPTAYAARPAPRHTLSGGRHSPPRARRGSHPPHRRAPDSKRTRASAASDEV